MTWGMVAVAGATLVGGLVSSNQSSQAAQGAAGAQTAASQAGIDEQKRQFDAVQALLAPYINAGTGALGQQQALLGMGGNEAQQSAIASLQASPQFQAITQQGENSILQNAAATGGLRGGNVQAALGQFRPQVLSQLIEQQYGRLGQMAQMGQASATGQAAMGQQLGSNISGLLTQQGQAQAGGYLAQGRASAQQANALGQFGGSLIGKLF